MTVNSDGESGTILPIRCKRWACPHCHAANRREVIRHAINGKPKRMLTLTVSSARHETHQDAAEAIKRGLRLLRLKLRRHPRLKDFEFIAIFEAHESGYPHLHLLIRGSFIPWAWLKARWTEITGSTHVDIRKVSGRKDAARYVAKYLGKDLHAFEGCKRWWRSHGYALAVEDNGQGEPRPGSWTRHNVVWDAIIASLEKEGWDFAERPGPRLEIVKPPGAQIGLNGIVANASQALWRGDRWDLL